MTKTIYAPDGRTALPLDATWHGTSGGYTNHFCRCDACRAVWSRRVRDYRERKAREPIPRHVHGTESGYVNYKCRCTKCTRASTIRHRVRRKKRKAGI